MNITAGPTPQGLNNVGQAGPGPIATEKSKCPTMSMLKANYPELHTIGVWAKGHYHGQCCLLKLLSGDRNQKLALAKEVFAIALSERPVSVTYHNQPMQDDIFDLESYQMLSLKLCTTNFRPI
jgi:hypothetical protein